MSAVELLAAVLPPRSLPVAPADGTCCVLGTREPCIPRRYAIGRRFTAQDLLQAPESDQVSVRAWQVLDRDELRQGSWVACSWQVGVRYLTRSQVRDLVLQGVQGPLLGSWAGYITTSRKKHGVLRAPVNRGSSQRWLFELEVVDCSDRELVCPWWDRLQRAYTAGIPRAVIESLDISLSLLAAHRDLWPAFAAWARPRHQSGLYRFLTYLL